MVDPMMAAAIAALEDSADEKSRILARNGIKDVPILFEVHEIINILMMVHDHWQTERTNKKRP